MTEYKMRISERRSFSDIKMGRPETVRNSALKILRNQGEGVKDVMSGGLTYKNESGGVRIHKKAETQKTTTTILYQTLQRVWWTQGNTTLV